MKKRMICMLLTLVMVFSLFPALAVTASADNEITITDYATLVTVKKGQTLIGICTSLKVNFDDVKAGIMVANDFNSETQLSRIDPNEKIWIPTSKSNSAAIVKNAYAFDEDGKAWKRSTGGGVATVDVNIPTEDVISYTIKSGDTIGKICKAHNLDYDTVKQAIVDLNPKRFSTIASLGRIQPNWVIYLPTSNSAAKEVSNIIETAEREIGQQSSSSANGDTFWGYVVKHQMAYGETIKSVCNTFGVSYSATTSDMVKTMNGIKNLNNVKAGSTYWFPSKTSNGTGYTVYSHTVVGGDTFGKLCSARGISYNNVAGILQGLNPGTNLNNIKRGQEVLVLGGSAKDGGAGGINIVIGGNSSGGGTGEYKITINTSANGTVKSSHSSADKGVTVKITATPSKGCALSSIKVTNTSNNANVTVTAGGSNTYTFVMPASAVKVDVVFEKAVLHKIIDKTPETAGSLKFVVNGKETTEAYTGDTVTIKPTAKVKGNQFASATYTYTKDKISYTSKIEGYTFTMPDSDANVTAKFDTTVKLSWTSPSALYGTMTVSCNGSTISAGSQVPKGSNIAVRIDPAAGYSVKNNQIKYNDGSDHTVTASGDGLFYFTMPSKDATIAKPEFDDAVYTIKFTKTTSCNDTPPTIKLDGKDVTSISKGVADTAQVKIEVTPNSGYAVDASTFTATNCSYSYDGDNKWTLTNFTGNVEIQVEAKVAYKLLTGTATNCTITFTANGKVISCVNKAAASTTPVVVTVTPDSGYSVIGSTFAANHCTVTKNDDGTWTLTNLVGDVTVSVTAAEAYTIADASTSNAKVSDITVDEVATTTASSGAIVKFKVNLKEGFSTDVSYIRVLDESGTDVTNLVTFTSLGGYKYQFIMPDHNVKISTHTMRICDISANIGWHKYSLDILLNGKVVGVNTEIKNGDKIELRFVFPHTVNTDNDNVIVHDPVIKPTNFTREYVNAEDAEYMTFYITVDGTKNVTYDVSNVWTP